MISMKSLVAVTRSGCSIAVCKPTPTCNLSYVHGTTCAGMPIEQR